MRITELEEDSPSTDVQQPPPVTPDHGAALPPTDLRWAADLSRAARVPGRQYRDDSSDDSDDTATKGTPKPKGRNKSKSIQARGETGMSKSRGTGFEDNYADPPMTVAEHDTESRLYYPSRAFHERIEDCIQRYRARRRLNNERADALSKYLALGGIDTTQRQFTGSSTLDLANSDYDRDQIRGMHANDALGHNTGKMGKFYDPECPEHWDVDFTGVVSGFLSEYLPSLYGTDDVNVAIDTIRNFLNYVLQHNVCPEYADDVRAAQIICDEAKVILPKCTRAVSLMPGQFNTAARIAICSTGKTTDHFNKTIQVFYEEKAQYSHEDDIGFQAPRDLDAERVFKTGIAIHYHSHPGIVAAVMSMQSIPLAVIRTYNDAFDITALYPATGAQKAAMAGVRSKQGDLGTVEPVGSIELTPGVIEDGWDNHRRLSDGPRNEKPLKLLLNDEIIACLSVGMKMQLTICETNVPSLCFIKECEAIYPPFYTYLPQRLMLNWKLPVENPRPAPSVENPEAEENDAAKEQEV